MLPLYEKYQLYKNAKIKWNCSKEPGVNKNIKVKCSDCGRIISFNGCSSHSAICKTIFSDKEKAFKQFFDGQDNCIVCGKELKCYTQSRKVELHCCSAKCRSKLNSFIHAYELYYKVCPICNNEFISKNLTCSRDCGYKLSESSISNWHFLNKDTEEYKSRLAKIGSHKNFSDYILKNGPWNKGMRGDEYISHFDKKDGTNSLFEGIKNNNKFFRKTSPEIKINDLLNELQIDYRYNVFHKNRQFDFSLRFEDFMIILEVDGDYWHKSIRCCNDETERKMQRHIDNLKEKIITEYNNEIRKFNREWFVIRFWEYDINNNIDVIKDFLTEVKNNTGNKDALRNIICEIKKYYTEKS